MTILLFGISNVGKTTIGKLLAEKLGYAFYDLDAEIKRLYNTTLEIFVKTGTLDERDCKRRLLLIDIMNNEQDKVIAVTPFSNAGFFIDLLEFEDVLAIELCDTVDNIFDRLIFSDENDVEYFDDEYKNKYKDYYLREIRADIRYYEEFSFWAVENKFEMKGELPEAVVERLILEYNLSSNSR